MDSPSLAEGQRLWYQRLVVGPPEPRWPTVGIGFNLSGGDLRTRYVGAKARLSSHQPYNPESASQFSLSLTPPQLTANMDAAGLSNLVCGDWMSKTLDNKAHPRIYNGPEQLK